MTVDSSWNVEKYRSMFEPEEHWNLKKEFMEAHKSLIEEDRLVCLAQVYANMELMGCQYPAPVMKQVKELATGLGDKYKSARKGKLMRTFVGASDAAVSKAKRQKNTKFQKGFQKS